MHFSNARRIIGWWYLLWCTWYKSWGEDDALGGRMQERCTGSLLLHTILTPPTELGNVLKQKVKASFLWKNILFVSPLSTHTANAFREMIGPILDEDWGWGIWPDLTFDTCTWKISGTQVIRPNWNWVLTVVNTILSRDFCATRLSVLCQIGCDVMMKKILWKWLVGCIQCTVPIIRANAQHFLDLINQLRLW